MNFGTISQLIDAGKATAINSNKIASHDETAGNQLFTTDVYGFECFIFLLVQQGEIQITTNNHTKQLTENTILLLKPFAPITNFKPSTDYKAKTLLIDRLYFEQTAESNRFLGLQNRLIASNGIATLQISPQQLTTIENTWNMLETIYETMATYANEGYEYMLNYIQLQTSDIIFQTVAQHRPKMVHKDRLWQDFLKLLSANYQHQHSITFYSTQLGITSTYLSRIVREASGRTVHAYIAERLYMAARHMLSTTDYTVSEIAYKLHFSDQSAFGKFFKSHAHISPLKYKNSQK